jgi:hypothetical protein
MITPELVDQIKVKLKASRAAYEHFFNTIDDPAWIKPLQNAGFFKNPEPPTEQDGYISFSFWPESQYLLKMADKAPDEVLLVVKDIPETKNQRVLEDIAQILLKMDADKAVRFTENIVKFLEEPYQLRLQDFAADLIIRFAETKHVRAALRIAETMLEVKPDPKKETLSKDDPEYILLEPQIKYRAYDYQEILEKITPALSVADPVKTTDFFSDLLDKTIKYKLLSFSETDTDDDESAWEDYSTIWRPEIAVTTRAYLDQPRDGLVSVLRDSLIALLKSDLPVDEKVKVLKSVCARKFKVFKRVVEYILRDYKDQSSFKSMYAKLFKELNPITDPKLLRQDPYEFTPSAGISIEELTALSDEEFIEKLKTYLPSEFRFEREAFGDLVGSLFKSDLSRYLKLSEKILDTKYQYVNSLLSAIVDNIDELSDEQLQTALSVAKDFLARPRPTDTTEEQYFDWSKMSLTRLLYKLVSQRENKSEYLSVGTASSTLELILKLCRDPDPTPAHEAQYGGDNMDPLSLSINTTRGEALHALARMIGWAERNKPSKEILDKIYAELLWHLNKENDPSLASRAIYGQWIPWIWGANKDWAKEHINEIFTPDEYGDAAWDSYITINQVFNDVFAFLKPVIEQRIEGLQKYEEQTKRNRGDPQGQFTQHLMVYYWRGLADLSDSGIIHKFFETADVHYRSEALRFIGFELKKGSPPDQEIIKRLKELWESRLKELSEHPEKVAEELEQFGSWFASGVFDDDWSLATLASSLKLAHNADPDYMVLERLSELAETFPLETMEALKGMIAGARERWAVDSWRENALTIIKSANQSQNTQAKQLAQEQANFLVAKGYHMFREALR